MYIIKMESVKKRAKRRAAKQLTKEDNQYDQSDDTRAGEFQKASSEQLKGRRIITPRRLRSRTQQQQPRQPPSPKRSLPPQQGESFDDNRRVKRIKRNNNPRLIRNILNNLHHEARPQPQAQPQAQIQQNQ